MTPGRPEVPERRGLTPRLAEASASRGHRRASHGQVHRAGRSLIEWPRHGVQLPGHWALLRRLGGWLHRHRSAGQTAPEKSTIDNGHVLEGHFWLPGREADRQAGVLRLGPGLAPSVATVEPMLSPWRKVSRTVQPDGRIAVIQEGAEEELTTPVTVHGLDDRGQLLSLVNAITVHWGGPDPAGYAHQFRGIQAVVGGHVRGRDHAFTGFRVRLRNMEAWRPRLRQAQWTAEAHLARGGSFTLEDLPISGQASGSALWLTGQSLPVPLEYSIERPTCVFASRSDVVMVGLVGAAQDRLLAYLSGARHGRPGVPRRPGEGC
jgi:ApeA N-terminal domain 1